MSSSDYNSSSSSSSSKPSTYGRRPPNSPPLLSRQGTLRRGAHLLSDAPCAGGPDAASARDRDVWRSARLECSWRCECTAYTAPLAGCWERAAGLGLSHMHRRTRRTHDRSRLRSRSPPALPVKAAVSGGCSGVRGAQLLPECESRGGRVAPLLRRGTQQPSRCLHSADARARVCAGSSYNPSNEILSMINKGGQVRRGTATAVALPPAALPND